MKNAARAMLWAAILLVNGTLYAQEDLHPLELQISGPNIVVKSGAEIPIDVDVRNASTKDVPVYRVFGDKTGIGYEIEVFDNSGKRLNKLADAAKCFSVGMPQSEIPCKRTAISGLLKPGQSFSDEIVISKQYDLSAPGDYRVIIERLGYLDDETSSDEPHSIGVSNELTITVKLEAN
jgi:hypothetical protein